MSAARPRVLLCVDEFKAGGVTTVMLDLARVLRDGVDIEFAAMQPGPWLDRVQELDLPVTIVPVGRMALLMRRFDLVHAHDRALGALAVATGLRGRLIEHVHGPYDDHPWVSFRGRFIVSVSNAVVDSLRTVYPHVRRASIFVVRNAAPPALLGDPTPRSRPDSLVAVGVGRLVEQKDPLAFVELTRALHDADPDFRAVWVGDGPLMGPFLTRIEELGLTGVLAWEELPPRERTVELMTTAGVMVLTSRWEGFPMVALEAAALGTPIATTECGDITEEVRRLRLGVVLDGNRDSEQTAERWAATIRDLWLDEARWLDASAQAKRAAVEEFSMDRLRLEVLDVYRAVLSDRRGLGARLRRLPLHVARGAHRRRRVRS